jgi:hypothetical protein
MSDDVSPNAKPSRESAMLAVCHVERLNGNYTRRPAPFKGLGRNVHPAGGLAKTEPTLAVTMHCSGLSRQ